MKNIKIKSNLWDVFQYEVFMYLYMYVRVHNSKLNINGKRNKARKNSYVESLLLHTRILTEIFLYQRKARPDDILLTNYINVDDFSDSMHSLIKRLDVSYNSSSTKNTPKFQIDKLMVHATDLRKSHHNYDKIISTLHPLILMIIHEIQVITNDSELKKYISYYEKCMNSYFTVAST